MEYAISPEALLGPSAPRPSLGDPTRGPPSEKGSLKAGRSLQHCVVPESGKSLGSPSNFARGTCVRHFRRDQGAGTNFGGGGDTTLCTKITRYNRRIISYLVSTSMLQAAKEKLVQAWVERAKVLSQPRQNFEWDSGCRSRTVDGHRCFRFASILKHSCISWANIIGAELKGDERILEQTEFVPASMGTFSLVHSWRRHHCEQTS